VILDEFLADGKPESCAVMFGGEKRVKNVFKNFLRNAPPVSLIRTVIIFCFWEYSS
jgi:hypothetical protein